MERKPSRSKYPTPYAEKSDKKTAANLSRKCFNDDQKSQTKNRGPFGKIVSSLLGKSKNTKIIRYSTSSKKSSNEKTPEVKENRKRNATSNENSKASTVSQLRKCTQTVVKQTCKRDPVKMEFLKSAQLSNTNLTRNSSNLKVRKNSKRDLPRIVSSKSIQSYKTATRNMENALVQKKLKQQKATQERDVFSFFDTGYVTSTSRPLNREESAKEPEYRSPLSTPGEEDDVYERKAFQAVEEDGKEGAYILKPVEWEKQEKSKGNAMNFRNHSTKRKNNKKYDRNPAYWYCKRIPENQSPDHNECNKYQMARNRELSPERLQLKLPRKLTEQEKKYLTYAVGIVLATAGIATFLVLLMRSRKKPPPASKSFHDDCCQGTVEDDGFIPESKAEACWVAEDDDACVYEKYQCVKCANPNYKALVSATEKLHEDDDVVCALQDMKKVTKRVKGNKLNNYNKRCPQSCKKEPKTCCEYFKDAECKPCEEKTIPSCERKCRNHCR